MAEITLIRFEAYELDPASRSLKRHGYPVALTPKTFDLLFYLASHPQQLVTKDTLLAAIWPDSFVEESNLSQHVFLLRKALASSGCGDKIVITIPGKGYQFIAPVEQAPMAHSPSPPSGAGAQTSAQPGGGFVLHSVRSVTSVIVEEEEDEAEDESLQAPPSRNRLNPAHPASQGRRRLGLRVASAFLGLAVVAGATFYLWRGAHPLPTEHLDLVLADLENSTGDQDFDPSINQALQIDLEQSPFLNLLSRSAIRDTLAQMQRKSGETLTPALAQEVCQRNNAKVMLHSSISRLGSKYLLMLDAESCISGKHLAGYTTQVSSKDELLSALDHAAGAVRKQLGESAASREQYQMAIAQATTPSFEALVAYNQAGESFRRGDMKGSQLLNQRAISLDPNFASAYRILGSSYYNLGDYAQAATYYKKAFEMRERTTERERLGIEVMYYGYALNDYEESIRRTKQFLQIYPNVANSWVSLSNLYGQLGEYALSTDAAEHAIHIDPHSGVAAVELARAYMHTGRFAEAKTIANAAIAQGKDHWDLHSILFQIAFAEHDAEKIRSEGQWGLTHQHINTSLRDLGFAAASAGKLHEARDDFARSREEALRDGETDFAKGILLDTGRVITYFAEPTEALKVLKQIPIDAGDPADPGESALLRGEDGDLAAARHFLAAAGNIDQRNTVKVYIYIPMIQALLALKANKPTEAVRWMDTARPYQLSDFHIPYLRAEAEAEAGMFTSAEQDYQLIFHNRSVDAISPLLPLAHLGLARVLVKERQIVRAKTEYGIFLDAWKDADPDIPLLRQAKQEYAALTKHP